MRNDWVYDLECLPNIFTCALEHLHAPFTAEFEISEWRNDSEELVAFLLYLKGDGARMFGYNNLAYDYNLIHLLLRAGKLTPQALYAKSQAMIHAQDNEDRWAHQVYPSDRVVPQVDIMKAYHYEFGSVKATGLKALEFAMRSDSIEELPFPFDKPLTIEQRPALKKYNRHDVAQTKKFVLLSQDMLQFREALAAKYPNKDWLNFNDVKIGVEYFIGQLEAAGVQCYSFGPDGREPRQTKRPTIALKDAILPWISFEHPEFQRIVEYLRSQVVTETKGVFKDLTAVIDGLTYVFGLGGLHASVSNEVVVSDTETMILDIDVEGYYPSTMVAQRFKPAHYPDIFCDIYASLKQERKKYKKGTIENALYKLASNGVFGKTNDKFSVFHDPLVTMQTTLNGQLLLCKLVEQLLKIEGLRICQANTDGLSIVLPRRQESELRRIVTWWEQLTHLTMEFAEYDFMAIRDVNNYVARKVDGTVKRKGAYEHQRGFHQDSSALVVPKVAEQVLLHGAPIRETVMNWPDKWDFFQRIKVPRSGYLTTEVEGQQVQVQNTSRYLVARNGVPLWKWLPPLKGKTEWRKFAVESGWKVCVCNRIEDATMPIDYEFYIQEVEKIVVGFR